MEDYFALTKRQFLIPGQLTRCVCFPDRDAARNELYYALLHLPFWRAAKIRLCIPARLTVRISHKSCAQRIRDLFRGAAIIPKISDQKSRLHNQSARSRYVRNGGKSAQKSRQDDSCCGKNLPKAKRPHILPAHYRRLPRVPASQSQVRGLKAQSHRAVPGQKFPRRSDYPK